MKNKIQVQYYGVDMAHYEARISENSKIEDLFWDNWNFRNIQKHDDLTTNPYDTLRTNIGNTNEISKIRAQKASL